MKAEENSSGTHSAQHQRLMVVWFPDWPAVAALQAAQLSAEQPLMVMHHHKVWACTAPARTHGVKRGDRRREAQRKLPTAVVVERDDSRDAQYFERIISALSDAAALCEVLRPGVIALSARSLTRFFGSEEVAAEKVMEAVTLAGVDCHIGISEGITAAVCAARRGKIIAPGAAAEFLAGLPLSALVEDSSLDDRGEREALIGVLERLGIRTVGAFAALPRQDVATRFDAAAITAHRIASGQPERILSPEEPAPELRIEGSYEQPLDRVDRAAFAGRHLATRMHEKLAARGESCTRIEIGVITPDGSERSRVWRCAEPLTEESTAARIRWQLDGWLAQSEGQPISHLWLMPLEVISGHTAQSGIWGDGGDEDERVRRLVARLQGVLGGDVVYRSIPSGGRSAAAEAVMLPVGDEPLPPRPVERPWKGALPGPVPAQTLARSIRVYSHSGEPVLINARGTLSAAPTQLTRGRVERQITDWAGPWLIDERWWEDPHGIAEQVVHARMHMVVQGLSPLLTQYRAGEWMVIGFYD